MSAPKLSQAELDLARQILNVEGAGISAQQSYAIFLLNKVREHLNEKCMDKTIDTVSLGRWERDLQNFLRASITLSDPFFSQLNVTLQVNENYRSQIDVNLNEAFRLLLQGRAPVKLYNDSDKTVELKWRIKHEYKRPGC